MTRALTPTELSLEREWLLEHGRSAEEVERMQRGADGRIELAVLLVDAWLSAKFVHLDLTGDMADDATIAAAQSHIETLAQNTLSRAVTIIADGRAVLDPGNERLMWEVDSAFRSTFSTFTTPAGASTPRPEGETVINPSNWHERNPRPMPPHQHEGAPGDCWCNNFPGAGAG